MFQKDEEKPEIGDYISNLRLKVPFLIKKKLTLNCNPKN